MWKNGLWPLPSTGPGQGFNPEQQNRFKELLLQSWNDIVAVGQSALTATGYIPDNQILPILDKVELPHETKEEPHWRELVAGMMRLISDTVREQVQQQAEQAVKTQSVEEWIARLNVEQNSNRVKTYQAIQPGDNSPGCQVLTDLLSWIDRIHDAFGGRTSLAKADIPKAQQYVWERMVAIQVKRNAMTPGSPLEELALTTFDLIWGELTTLDNSGYLTDTIVKGIMRRVIENPNSLLQYYSIASFFQHLGNRYYEIGIIVTAGRNINAGQNASNMAGILRMDAVISVDGGAAETFLFLQTQPSIFEKVKLYFRNASNSPMKSLIISDVYGQSQIKVDNFNMCRVAAQIGTEWRDNERTNFPKRALCAEMSCIPITTDELPDIVSPLHMIEELKNKGIFPAHQTKFALRKAQSLIGMGGTLLEQDIKRNYMQVKHLAIELAKKNKTLKFPVDFISIVGFGLRTPYIFLDPRMCIACPMFSEVDMHSGANNLGIGNAATLDRLATSLKRRGLLGTWPYGDTTPAAGQCMSEGQWVETIVTGVDAAKSIFKADFPNIISQAVHRAIRGEENRRQVSVNSLSNVLLTSLGFYSPHLEFPKLGLSDLTKNVRLDIKNLLTIEGSIGNKAIDFIPVLLAIKQGKLTTLESFSALNNILLNACGHITRDEAEGTCVTHESGCVCGRDDLNNGTPLQSFVDCWSGKNIANLTQTEQRNRRKALVNWCPCHGAFVRNFGAVLSSSPSLEPFIKLFNLTDLVARNDMVSYTFTPTKIWGDALKRSKGGKKDFETFIRSGGVVQDLEGSKVRIQAELIQTTVQLIIIAPFSVLMQLSANGSNLYTPTNTEAQSQLTPITADGLFGSNTEHLVASGTLMATFVDPTSHQQTMGVVGNAGSLTKLDTAGLGICSTQCGCGGLCLGNQLWATMGLLILNTQLGRPNSDELQDILKEDAGLCISALITCVEQFIRPSGSGSPMSIPDAVKMIIENSSQIYGVTVNQISGDFSELYNLAIKAIYKLLSDEVIRPAVTTQMALGSEDFRPHLNGKITQKWLYGEPGALPEGAVRTRRAIELQIEDYENLIKEYYEKDDNNLAQYTLALDDLRKNCILEITMDNNEVIYVASGELGGGMNDDGKWVSQPSCDSNEFDRGGTVSTEAGKGNLIIHAGTLHILAERQQPKATKTAKWAKAANDMLRKPAGNKERARLAQGEEQLSKGASTVGVLQKTTRNALMDLLQEKITSIRDTFASNVSVGAYSYTKEDVFENSDPDKWNSCIGLLREINGNDAFKNGILVGDLEKNAERINIKRIDAEQLAPVIFYLVEIAENKGISPEILHKVVDMVTGIKTDGDLHQLTVSLQIPNQGYKKYAAVLMALFTGDFAGTALGATFCRLEEGELIAPRICLTAKQSTVTVGGNVKNAVAAGPYQESEGRPMCYLPMCIPNMNEVLIGPKYNGLQTQPPLSPPPASPKIAPAGDLYRLPSSQPSSSSALQQQQQQQQAALQQQQQAALQQQQQAALQQQQQAAQKEAALKEAAQKEAALKEAAQKEAALKEAAQKEAAPQKEAARQAKLAEEAEKEKAAAAAEEAEKEKAAAAAAEEEKAARHAHFAKQVDIAIQQTSRCVQDFTRRLNEEFSIANITEALRKAKVKEGKHALQALAQLRDRMSNALTILTGCLSNYNNLQESPVLPDDLRQQMNSATHPVDGRTWRVVINALIQEYTQRIANLNAAAAEEGIHIRSRTREGGSRKRRHRRRRKTRRKKKRRKRKTIRKRRKRGRKTRRK